MRNLAPIAFVNLYGRFVSDGLWGNHRFPQVFLLTLVGLFCVLGSRVKLLISTSLRNQYKEFQIGQCFHGSNREALCQGFGTRAPDHPPDRQGSLHTFP